MIWWSIYFSLVKPYLKTNTPCLRLLRPNREVSTNAEIHSRMVYYAIASSPSSPILLPVSFRDKNTPPCATHISICSANKVRKLSYNQAQWIGCRARRRVRYGVDDDEDEAYGYNVEIAMLEFYSQSAREEALLVRAMVDDQEEEVLIFKGFSSCLSNRTSSDPSKSVLPARAVIKSIDRVKGPFNSANIEYIEKGLTWEAFKSRLQPN